MLGNFVSRHDIKFKFIGFIKNELKIFQQDDFKKTLPTAAMMGKTKTMGAQACNIKPSGMIDLLCFNMQEHTCLLS